MKFEFNYEKGSKNRWSVFMYLACPITAIILAYCFPDKYRNYIKPSFYIFAIIWLIICVIISNRLEGYIFCEQNTFAVCRGRIKRIISIEDIESVSCLPELHRPYSVKHMLVFTVILKTGKKLAFCTCLDVDKDMPVQQPEKFKEYIAEQPMMKLYEYINKCLGAK